MSPPRLITFAGLPGTGKSSLARALADRLAAIYLRVDSAEEALRASALAPPDVMDAGYRVLWALATDNLALGHDVIGDSVNPIALTRAGWDAAAQQTGAHHCLVEIICSDPAEHRSRVETRRARRGQGPTWADVTARPFAPITAPRITLDTAGQSPDTTLITLLSHLPHRTR
ncbi:MAG: AAA family ATPase [Pseudomonadota bacterium]